LGFLLYSSISYIAYLPSQEERYAGQEKISMEITQVIQYDNLKKQYLHKMINRNLILSGTTKMNKENFFSAIDQKLKEKGYFKAVNYVTPKEQRDKLVVYINDKYKINVYYPEEGIWTISISSINSAKDQGF